MEEAMLHNANRGTDLTDIPTSLQSCIDIREQARETLMFLSSDALKYDESNRSLVSIQTVSKAQEIVFRSLVEKILFKKTGENFSLFGTKHVTTSLMPWLSGKIPSLNFYHFICRED